MLFAWAAVVLLSPVDASALTVRTKSDLRLWQTVFDRAEPLVWDWVDGAEEAAVTFSNRLTRTVSRRVVLREPSALRGHCPQPEISPANEAFSVVTLVQKAGIVEISRATAALAYVRKSITVRSKSGRDWWRVPDPRLAAYDARWWNVSGPSGYEIPWGRSFGWQTVTRAFEGAGVVDRAELKFGLAGLLLMIR